MKEQGHPKLGSAVSDAGLKEGLRYIVFEKWQAGGAEAAAGLTESRIARST